MTYCRSLFVFLLFLFLQGGAFAAESNLVVPSAGGPVAVRVYPASGEKARPTVLILHAGSGLALGEERYASETSAAGMDAWLFSYYSAAYQEVMHSADRSRRGEYFNERFRDWAKTISDIAGFALAQQGSSGRLGLLGLSNGGVSRRGYGCHRPTHRRDCSILRRHR
jgi:dienelactone hydrolase